MAESILVNLLEEMQIRDEALSEEELQRHMPSFLNNIISQSTSWKNKTSAITVINNQFRYSNPLIKNYIDEILSQLSKNDVLTMKNCSDDDSLSDFADFYREFVFSMLIFQDHFPQIFVKYFKQILKIIFECLSLEIHMEQTALQKAIREYIKITSLEFWASLKIPPVPEEFMETWSNAVKVRVKHIIPILLDSMILQEEHAVYLENGSQEQDKDMDGISFNEIVMRQSNVRNFAALSLENLTSVFPTEVSNELKPFVENWINDDDWKKVEAMMLAVSAYSNAIGVPPHMLDVLNNSMAKILDLLSNSNSLLRAISCFALSHIINFNIKNPKEVMNKVIRRTYELMGDKCEETHNSALRAISKIINDTPFNSLQPYFDEIYNSLIENRDMFKDDDHFVYFECCSQFCIASQDSINRENKSILLMPMFDEWLSHKMDSSRDLIDDDIDSDMVRLSHMFCVTLQYAGELFEDHIERIFVKLDETLLEINEIRGNNDQSSGDVMASDNISSYLVSCLDVINSVFEGLPARAISTAKNHSFLTVLYDILNEPYYGKCHQSAFSLLGHMIYSQLYKISSKTDGDQIRGPDMSEFLKLVYPVLEKKEASNIQCNALWALVCIIKTKQVPFQTMQPVVDHLIEIFKQTDGQQDCIVNAAWALTQLFTHYRTHMTNIIVRQDVFAHLCALLQFQFTQEYARVEIVESFVSAVQSLMKKFSPSDWVNMLITIACNSVIPNDPLQAKIKTFLQALRTEIGIPTWNKVMQDTGPQCSQVIKKAYKIP